MVRAFAIVGVDGFIDQQNYSALIDFLRQERWY